jgi:hypothetical protein
MCIIPEIYGVDFHDSLFDRTPDDAPAERTEKYFGKQGYDVKLEAQSTTSTLMRS